MNRIVHFEIYVDDMPRATKFYTDVFGWAISEWSGGGMTYMTIMTAPAGSTELGINGGMIKRPAPAPAPEQGLNAFACTVVVENYDVTAAKILAAGGREAMPKFAIPGMAWQGYFLDTEGNTFGIHQADPNAK
jgi:predicted enzyme related to lactoylglutathione lyase